jgi:DNA invertase Pin-like site-specific DNA recombinase
MTPRSTTRAALYARVSTTDQTCENQLAELRAYCAARGWTVMREYVDAGVSGSKDRRPALDAMAADARRRRFGTLLCWRLDRLGRNLRHLVVLLEELQATGVNFVSLGEGIDLGTPAGRLQLHILAALAEFERERIRERVFAGLARARTRRLSLRRTFRMLPVAELAAIRGAGLTVRAAAKLLGVSPATAHRWLSQQSPTIPPLD